MESVKKIKTELLPERVDKLTNWIKKKVKNAGKKGVILGLSGGIDSAVLAVLCKRAFPESTMALILPCESIKSDITDAMKIIKKYQINFLNLDLTPLYQQILSITNTYDLNNKMAKANIKPRLRMTLLYYYASILDYLVVGATNKSELFIGYFTKYGDGGVDILPLGNIVKSDIFKIAKYLEIPENIISKPPSAGLWENQTDEKEMGFSYEDLDSFLEYGKIKNNIFEEKIFKMNRFSTHKRNRPPIPKI